MAAAISDLAAASREPLPVRQVTPAAIGTWLRKGWADLLATPVASLAHGVAVALGGWLALFLAHRYAWLGPGAISGFVIVGPILCTGLYELSRLTARGERPGLANVIDAWRRESRPLLRMGLLLFGMGTAWVAVSALLFWVFLKTPPRTAVEFLRYAAVEQGNVLFTAWILAGALGCAFVFALSAVAPPLLLGRRVGFRRALLTSVRAVGDNPVTMGLWAAAIMIAIALSFATAMLGFIVTVPLIGHATWHAYKDLVVTDGVPLRYE
ncbi:MAG: DUF2189 domain-containing protein [Burkholderiales bacterium]